VTQWELIQVYLKAAFFNSKKDPQRRNNNRLLTQNSRKLNALLRVTWDPLNPVYAKQRSKDGTFNAKTIPSWSNLKKHHHIRLVYSNRMTQTGYANPNDCNMLQRRGHITTAIYNAKIAGGYRHDSARLELTQVKSTLGYPIHSQAISS